MNWADFAILGLILFSTLVSLLRGFVKEAISLATWIVALWIAIVFADEFAPLLEPWVEIPSARTAIAMLVLLLAVLVLGAMVNYLMGQLVKKTGMSGTDRVLGSVFGVARGVVVVGLLVLLAGFTAVPQDPWWHESALMHHFQELAVWAKSYLPPGLAEDIKY